MIETNPAKPWESKKEPSTAAYASTLLYLPIFCFLIECPRLTVHCIEAEHEDYKYLWPLRICRYFQSHTTAFPVPFKTSHSLVVDLQIHNEEIKKRRRRRSMIGLRIANFWWASFVLFLPLWLPVPTP